MLRDVAIVLLATASISSLGCVQFYDSIDEQIIECRQKKVAKKAWNRNSDYWENEIHKKDFEAAITQSCKARGHVRQLCHPGNTGVLAI